MVQLRSPEKLRRDYITSDPSATCGPSGKVTGSEGHVSNNININDPTSTLGPSRDPTDPSASGVTAEPIDPNRCLRPLQRARERRAARLKEPSDLRSHLRESSVLSAWEQERVYLFCEQCNNKLTDSDWLKFKNEGRDVENVTHCYPCMDSILMANFVPPTSSLM